MDLGWLRAKLPGWGEHWDYVEVAQVEPKAGAKGGVHELLFDCQGFDCQWFDCQWFDLGKEWGNPAFPTHPIAALNLLLHCQEPIADFG
jgi:hypothetical protein